ncbi:MAG: hypothetical protein A2Y93_02095 [Chloroflexi bacterium RBG_13_68_17]|nr:MAG: hypothetical protein A2Y93_02095 [Chloroflexi bacterium RBG_13_68_17]
MYLYHEVNWLPLLALLGLWAAGGWLVAARLFDLAPEERSLVGFGLGLTLSTWTANVLAHVLPLTISTWGAAVATLGAGVLLAYPVRRQLRGMFTPTWGQWGLLLGLSLLFTLVGRGLAVLDDYQNLPILSRIAAGDVPPHFPFAQDVRLGYHYFLLLVGAQFLRVAGAAPWTAIDMARGLALALAILLIGLLAYRMTRNYLAFLAGALFGAFAGGARWMLLLLPPALVPRVSASVQLIGSGAESGSSLAEALMRPWALEGGAPLPFPFAYASGVNAPLIMALSGYGAGPMMLIMLLLLLGDRGKVKAAWGALAILIASLALLAEHKFVFLVLAAAALVVWRMIRGRSIRIPAALAAWGLTALAASGVAALQGGLLAELAESLVNGSQGPVSYYEVAFRPIWPPTIVSSQLGNLSLTNPYQLLVAFLEFGPVLLAAPLVAAWGVTRLKEGKWLEVSVILAGGLSLFMPWFRYSGNAGPTATTRLYSMFIDVCLVYAVPLSWRLLAGSGRAIKMLVVGTGIAATLSGVVLFAIQLTAVPRPVASHFLTALDVTMYHHQWDALPAEAMVFDARPSRAVTVFGRVADSQLDLSGVTPEYAQLVADLDLGRVHAAGFDYLYYDRGEWQRHQAQLSADCVRPVDEVVDILSATGEIGDFRRLVDIRACR